MEVDDHSFAVIFLKLAKDPVSILKREYPQVAATCRRGGFVPASAPWSEEFPPNDRPFFS